MQDLTSPVVQSVPVGPSSSRRCTRPVRIGHADRTRTAHPRTYYGSRKPLPETPLVGSISTFPPRWRSPALERFARTLGHQEHPFACRGHCRPVTVTAAPTSLLPVVSPAHPLQRIAPSAPVTQRREGVSHQPLQPISFHEHPERIHALERRACAVLTSASGAAPFRRLLCRRGNNRHSREASDDHEGSPTSSGAAFGTARASWNR